MSPEKSFTVSEEDAGLRLDVFLAQSLVEYSRSKLRNAITNGQVLVNQRKAKPSYRLDPGETISCNIQAPESDTPKPENIPLDILFDDQDIVVINKPPGMVVHPSKGHWEGTLTAALAYHFENLSSYAGQQRPGIVHRLDRDTSGVIVVARNDAAHMNLAAQFENRTVEKEYFAIVSPPPDRQRDWIEQPIGPHPYQREKMAIRPNHPHAKKAKTFYEVIQQVQRLALVKVLPRTGRTHQIRVHFQHIGCPVLADRLYSGAHEFCCNRSLETAANASPDAPVLKRQALHARRLQLKHPRNGKTMEFHAEIAPDIQQVVSFLQDHCN